MIPRRPSSRLAHKRGGRDTRSMLASFSAGFPAIANAAGTPCSRFIRSGVAGRALLGADTG